MRIDKDQIWILLDDRAGNRSQVIGVAKCLNRPVENKNLIYSPLAKLPNIIIPPTFATLNKKSQKGFVPPWPGLVIGAGRRTAPVARQIKKLSAGATRIVQIMDPGGTTKDFDLICVPTHDARIKGSNVFQINSAPHSLTPEVMNASREKWLPKLSHLPMPRIAVIVGGSTRRRQFTQAMAENLGLAASAMAKNTGGSLLITTSRRSADIEQTLINSIQAQNEFFRWEDKQENPYLGYLACADVIIVTGESVSMCTEACASTVPVYLFAPPKLVTAKHQRFHKYLIDQGYAQYLSNVGEIEARQHPILNSSFEIADMIRSIMEW